MNKIYTAGYSGHTVDQLRQAVAETGAMVVDIRMFPRSRMRQWDRKFLHEALGEENYRHLPEWGNVNFRNGPIRLNNAPLGLAWAVRWARLRPIILLCGCPEYSECHRRTCAGLLHERGIETQELAWPVSPAGAGHVKCLSLHQPWASLIGTGAKRIETRHWSTSYRGPLLIHAAKNRTAIIECWNDPFFTVLESAGLLERRGFQDVKHFMPLGAVVCVADLVDCVPTERLSGSITEQEHAFGDYSPNRYGWILENIRAFPQPIPLRGQQGIWDVAIDLEAALRGGTDGSRQEDNVLQANLF